MNETIQGKISAVNPNEHRLIVINLPEPYKPSAFSPARQVWQLKPTWLERAWRFLARGWRE